MTQLIPNRSLMDIELPLTYRKRTPRLRGDLTDFSQDCLLPPLCELDGQDAFADVYACWNESGLYVGICVENKTRRPNCDPKAYWKSDVLRLCIDTRDARNIKRASRYCQAFYALPLGGGRGGSEPIAASHKIQRAREDAPPVPPGALPIASCVSSEGYTLELHLPADQLNGFDPAEHPRIGFYYMIEDSELGQQALTVGDELYWYVDPSTWATVVLAR